MADSIEQQLMWCNRARVILAATSGKGQKAVIKFDNELSKVRVKLDRLIEMAGEETPVVKGFVEELGAIAVLASGLRDVADPKYKGKSGQKTLRNEAKQVTTKLEELGKKIEKSEPAKDILEARTRFFDSTARTRKRLKELGSQEHADTADVQELLSFIETAEQSVRTEVKYQQPAECDKATRLISEWLNQLALKMENRAKGSRQLDESQAKAKPLVEDKAGTARRLLAEGRTSGQLTPELERKLDETLKAIDLKGAAGLWTEALVLCKSLPTAAQCRKAYLLAKGGLKKEFREQMNLCETALDGLAVVLEASAMEQERSRYNQLIAKGGGDMTTLIQGWNNKTAELTRQQQQLDKLIVKLRERVARREERVPLQQKAENARQLDLVTSLREQLQFTAGTQAAETLSRQLDPQREAVDDGRAWQKIAGEAVQLSASMDNWSKAQRLAADLRAAAARLSKVLDAGSVAQLTTVRDWKTLLAAHKEATEFLATANQASQAFGDFEGRRGELRAAMLIELAKVDKAFEDYGKVAAKAGIDAAPPLLPLRGELRALTDGWEEWLSNAVADDKSRVDAVKSAIGVLLGKIDDLDDETLLKAEAARQADEAGRARFNTAKSDFETRELVDLKALDAVLGEETRKRLEALAGNEKLDQPGKPWEGRIEALAQLVFEAKRATGEARGRLRLEGETQVQMVAEHKRALLALRQSMKTKKIDVKKFESMLGTLDTDLANLELLTTTGNITAFDVNKRLLEAFGKRVETLQMLVEHGSAFEDYGVSLKRYETSIGKLDDDGLGKMAPATLKALKEQLSTLQDEVYGQEPKAADKSMRALALAISDAGKELTALTDLKNKASVAASDCLRRVGAFAKKGFAEIYRKSLESRVAAARDRAANPAELPAALRDFEAIQAELSELEANPDAAYTRQKNVLAEQHATLKLKREWEGRLSVIKGSVMSRLKAALKTGDDSQKAEVERMIEMAETAVKKNKDYERGLRLLTQVEGRVAQIERNPEGTALGDRKALPKHVEGYSANVIKLRQALDNFVTQSVAQLADKPGLQTKVREILVKQVDPLTLQLNPGLFAAPLKTLLDGQAAATQRREAREQALARLREAVGFLTTHPTMVKLAGNPIVPLQPDMRALDASLTRLEAHLRAAVR